MLKEAIFQLEMIDRHPHGVEADPVEGAIRNLDEADGSVIAGAPQPKSVDVKEIASPEGHVGGEAENGC